MTASWKPIRYHSGNLGRSKLFLRIEGKGYPIPFDVSLHLNVKIVKAILGELPTTSVNFLDYTPACGRQGFPKKDYTHFLQVPLGYDPLEDRKMEIAPFRFLEIADVDFLAEGKKSLAQDIPAHSA